MSKIVLNKADSSGDVDGDYTDINAMFYFECLQHYLEEKYLPEYKRPRFSISECKYFSRFFLPTKYKKNGDIDFTALQEIWDLFYDKRLSRNEKIVLGSIFDKSFIFKKNYSEFIEALRSFRLESNLNDTYSELADLIEKDNESIAFNLGCSMSNDRYSPIYNEDSNVEIFYNVLVNKKHDDLFELLEEVSKK